MHRSFTLLDRYEIEKSILGILKDQFEISDPGMDDDLREKYKFDSIDGIELLAEVEQLLGFEIDQEIKKQALEIRTVRQIVDWVEKVQSDNPQSDNP